MLFAAHTMFGVPYFMADRLVSTLVIQNSKYTVKSSIFIELFNLAKLAFMGGKR